MKRLTIIFSILLVLGFAGMMGYIAMSPDFTEPDSQIRGQGGGTDSAAPVWSMTLEDLEAYLVDKGLIDPTDAIRWDMDGGMYKVWRINGADFYWWDLENLDPESDAYAEYAGYRDDGFYVHVTGTGETTFVRLNGPFGLRSSGLDTRDADGYDGDMEALVEAFEAFGQADKVDLAAPVWNMTMEDLEAYLADKGLIDPNSKKELGTGNPAEVVWRVNGADFYWWDLENLDPESDAYAEYAGYRDDGFYVFVNGTGETVFVELNGPFGLRSSGLNTRDADGYDGDMEALVAAFEAFGKE